MAQLTKYMPLGYLHKGGGLGMSDLDLEISINTWGFWTACSFLKGCMVQNKIKSD